jgi:predicted nucleic acid-binding protein
MSTLVDTSILTRAIHQSSPMHQVAIDGVVVLRQQGEQLYLVPQNFYEFWVVCTRPAAQNGLGMTPTEVETEISRLEQLFAVLPDTPDIFPEWKRIVTQHQVCGKNGHDARLVAAMSVHGVNRILTFNTQDFQRYQGIVVVSPQQIVNMP